MLAICVQLFLAGEGVFRLNNIKHDCDKKILDAGNCLAGSKTLDAHRALGFFLTLPGALLFLIVALVAWHANKRIRWISIAAPILAFLQSVWAGIGGWAGGIHVLNALLVTGTFIWLAVALRREQEAVAVETAPVAAPA